MHHYTLLYSIILISLINMDVTVTFDLEELFQIPLDDIKLVLETGTGENLSVKFKTLVKEHFNAISFISLIVLGKH